MSMSAPVPAPAPSAAQQQQQQRPLLLPSIFHFEGWEIHYRLTGHGTGEAPTEAAAAADEGTDAGAGADAEPLVFVHGTPWCSAVFAPVIEALQEKEGRKDTRPRRTILVYDLPGYGQSQVFQTSRRALAANSTEAGEKASPSSPPTFLGDTSVRFQARAFAALLAHTKLTGSPGAPAPLCVAHDIAGTIVLRAHLVEGCAFSRLLCVDTNTVLPWGDGFYKLVREEPGPFTRLPPGIFEAMLRAVTRSACYRGEVLSEGEGEGEAEGGWEDVLARPWLSHSEGAPSQDGQHSFVRQIAQANDADVAELLDVDAGNGGNGGGYSNVRCDVTVLWGEEDQWIPREKVETFIGMLGERCKRAVFVPQAGHLLMLDQPEVFEREVMDWLEIG